MLTSIHSVELRLQGVLAAVDEVEVGDIGLDEDSKAQKSRFPKSSGSEWARVRRNLSPALA